VNGTKRGGQEVCAQRGQKGGSLAKRGGAKVKSVKARRQDTEKTHSEATGSGRRIWGR
jgi:hypothetical protein